MKFIHNFIYFQILSLAVAAFHLYELGLSLVATDETNEKRFGNFEKVETIFGKEKQTLVALIIMIYYLTYVIIGLLMFIFSAIFTCGAYKV